MSGGDRLSPFCDSHQNFDLGLGWKEKNRCNAYHDWFLHFCLLIVNIKGGSVLVESVLWISNSSQDSRWTESSLFLFSLAALCKFLFCYIFPRLIWMFQAVWGGGKEAQVIFCQHERHHLHPADCLHLLCDLTYRYHLHREEEENHLLGRDGTRRSSSAVHLQEGSWRRICATRRGELEGEREQGGKVPPLLDHHHLHLHLHLLHNHLLGFKRTLHTGRRKRMCIDLNLKILNIFRLVVFVWLICFCYLSFPYIY